MVNRQFIPYATQSYKSASLPVSAQRCVNMYAETEPPDSKTQVAIFGLPGLSTFCTVGTGPIRGMLLMGSTAYAVSGSSLFQINADGSNVFLGGPISGLGVVQMSQNGTQIIIINAASGYVWSQAGGFQQITSPNFYPCSTVTFFDDYFVFDRIGTNQFFISGLLDGLSYAPLDFASAEVQPDYVVAVLNQQENLLIFGQKSIETWYDSGAVDFPFARYDGATIERGCIAPLTVVKEDNSVFFLGDDLIFYRLNGVVPVRISTHAIEQAWTDYTRQSDAFCFSYTRAGHKFLVLTFPTANKTWSFDISTNLWHERESFDINGTSLGRWRGNCYLRAYNRDLVGDAFSNKIGFIDDSTYEEFGNMMKAMLVGPYVHNLKKRIFFSRFEVDMEVGVGTVLGQGVDPQIMLDWSDDGGRTFDALQIWHGMGKAGENKVRVFWLNLGEGRQRCWRLTITDPVKRTIMTNNVNISIGML